MTEEGSTLAPGAGPSLPPATFAGIVEVPSESYKTAIAIQHEGRMTLVEITFILQGCNDGVASYSAVCPRCQIGPIELTVKFNQGGSFVEAPAFPALCLACEDRLDAIIDPQAWAGLKEEPTDRETLSKQIKAMKTRAWD